MRPSCFFIFCLCLFSATTANYTMVNNRLHQVVYVYPNQVREDKDLEICENGVARACGMVHKRFWLLPLVYRNCRCPQPNKCSHHWSEYKDNRSIPINNMAQFKFCDDIADMHICKENEMGLIMEEKRLVRGQTERNVTALCNCVWPTYWQLGIHNTNATHTYNTYYCKKLKVCQLGDFCGHIRVDTYSVYYQCKCPMGSICVRKDPKQRFAAELLYEGPMHRAYCQKPI